MFCLRGLWVGKSQIIGDLPPLSWRLPGGFDDGGAAANASISRPHSVAVHGLVNLFISDTKNDGVGKVKNSINTTVADSNSMDDTGGGSVATNTGLFCIGGMTFSGSRRQLILDLATQAVQKMGTKDVIWTAVDNGQGGSRLSPQGGYPRHYHHVVRSYN